ncbi:nitrogen regulation protein NR(I) [Kiloniella laminariae]|uniref:DNA-binding transcriptional regulator NtrC n=1 Tax=Kiloniella laminariae TaxID=454162 RepID=A0ABT4LLU4_9PROT|nr:nitrogen regulation protein NR(I) [Kiloniella laminariae]MCZ4282073.1 nitrogen regulation protein NR(I) [Kiloniella laminariae]
MKQATILIADDDQAIRTVLTHALGREGYRVQAASSAASLWQWVARGEGDLVITDVVMPDENGLDLIPRIKKIRPELRIIVMSAQNTLLTAVKATERGAFEYLPKPFDLRELSQTVRRALSEPQESIPAEAPAPEPEERLPLIGRSVAMQEIYRVMARLMATDLTVMVTGESGTGKELISRALHDYGKRKSGPFVAINMAAIPKELIESELFGHEKGAFTGATSRYSGKFEQAAGGTLFLDEIGDMPLEAQTRLLRVLQENEFTTVGGRTAIKADVRIITATHRDLIQMVKQGLFREDLYYRLSVVPLRLPPLRERSEDVPELVSHFLRLCEKEGLPNKVIDQSGMAALRSHYWTGNVRELENIVRRLTVLYSQDTITREVVETELNLISKTENREGTTERMAPAFNESLGEAVERHLSEYFAAHYPDLPSSGLYERILKEIEKPLISLSLSATNSNQIQASKLLGLNRNTLRKKIKELDVPLIKGGR